MMKIAPIQSGRGEIPMRIAVARDEPAPKAASRGKVRHVLHGWRVLVAPVVTQVLARAEREPEAVPPEIAIAAYRRRQSPPPEPQHLRYG